LWGTSWPVSRILCARRNRAGDHPSRTAVADGLVRSTRELGRAALERSLSDLAPGGVCRAARVTPGAGGLLHHRFTLAGRRSAWRFAFCGTVPRVAPGGRYPPPCPVESGLSSAEPGGFRRGRPASSSAVHSTAIAASLFRSALDGEQSRPDDSGIVQQLRRDDRRLQVEQRQELLALLAHAPAHDEQLGGQDELEVGVVLL
jgi:hypothetical protein